MAWHDRFPSQPGRASTACGDAHAFKVILKAVRAASWRNGINGLLARFFPNFLVPREAELTGDFESNLGSQI
jgi:hypothetical protein